MVALVRVILSTRATWVVANDAVVVENVRTTSMMVRKSRVEIMICCKGGAKMLAATSSIGAVLGARGPEKTEGSRAVAVQEPGGGGGGGGEGGDAGTEGA